MKFTKMHGCGNDYIYFDCTKDDFPGGPEGEKQAAIKLSDRHFGIGGDGIIIIKKGHTAEFEMVMYNADGSRSQMESAVLVNMFMMPDILQALSLLLNLWAL